MALPQSSLSTICTFVQTFLRDGLDATNNNIRVVIGAPADAAQDHDGNKHRVNLFFYRFEPAGLGPNLLPGEPWLIRMHCLITVFGEIEDKISAGENELRVLGEIMRLFHEQPVLETLTVDGETLRLQVVFQPLTSDEMNHIWSTQSETSFRASLAYEMALGVVVPKQRHVPAPLVGAIGSELRARIDARHAPFGGNAFGPPVEAGEVPVEVESWAPRICFVRGGRCFQSIALSLSGGDVNGFNPPSIWVAGDSAATVTLRWQIWDSVTGWHDHPATLAVQPVSSGIDPDGTIPATLSNFALPFNNHAGQAVLYAVRQYTRSDGAVVQVRSNPLLVSVF